MRLLGCPVAVIGLYAARNRSVGYFGMSGRGRMKMCDHFSWMTAVTSIGLKITPYCSFSIGVSGCSRFPWTNAIADSSRMEVIT